MRESVQHHDPSRQRTKYAILARPKRCELLSCDQFDSMLGPLPVCDASCLFPPLLLLQGWHGQLQSCEADRTPAAHSTKTKQGAQQLAGWTSECPAMMGPGVAVAPCWAGLGVAIVWLSAAHGFTSFFLTTA